MSAEPTIAERLEAARSRVHGIESALAERAVRLLDKLSHATIHPYAMSSSETDMASDDITEFDEDDLRNPHDGPMLLTRMRAFVDQAVAAAAVSAMDGQFSLQISDIEGRHHLMRDPVFMPVLFDQDTSTWSFDRPYVLGPGSALMVRAREDASNATGDMHVSALGEVVVGGPDASELEEALLLGVYPVAGRQSSIWDHELLMDRLFGVRPPRLSGEADDLLADLRDRVFRLRQALLYAVAVPHVLEVSTDDLTASSETPLNREELRNDELGPMMISGVRLWTAAARAASSASAVFSNVDLRIESVSERIRLMSDPVMASVLVSYESGAWRFDRPHALRSTGSMQVHVEETAADGTTDVHVAFEGEALAGLSFEDARAATALGLYPSVHRKVW